MLITLSSQSTTASLASNLASSAPSTSLKIRVNQIAVHCIATASSLLLLLSLQLLNNIQVSIHSPFKSDALFYILKMRKNSSECLYAEHHQNVYLYMCSSFLPFCITFGLVCFFSNSFFPSYMHSKLCSYSNIINKYNVLNCPH